jgi:hypothetical protein
MIPRNPLLQRNIAEHPILNPLVSTHTSETNANNFQPQTGSYFFNKFLEFLTPASKLQESVASTH